MVNWKCAIFIAAFGCCVTAVHAQTARKPKGAAPPVATQTQAENLRSPIPFDKRYEELSPQQLEVLRSTYDNLGENDEPPFPEGGLAGIVSEIAKLPHKASAPGLVVITVRVDEKGDSQSASVDKTPDDEFAKSIAAIVTAAKYKPAKCAGSPCAMDFSFIFEVGAY